MWKAGCLVALLGVALSVGSLVFFGTAIKKAVSHREVTNERVTAGSWFESEAIRVDSGGQIQVQITARVELGAGAFARADSSASIEQISANLSYDVRDEIGEIIYNESGSAEGSTIIPDANSTHRSSFDPVTLCTFEGTKFDAPESGIIRVSAEIPETDNEGNQVLSGQLTVHDQIPKNASRWAFGGLASMLGGPLVTFVGLIIFVIGLFKRKKAAVVPRTPPVPRT